MMNYCLNHPEKEAYGICHFCGKYFCKECITEGKEFNSCNSPECLKANEFTVSPDNIVCPECGTVISVEENEITEIHCPECSAMIDYSVIPCRVIPPKKYAEAIWSLNQGDLFIIKSLLDSGDIDYYTTGEIFLSVDPLIQPARFFVLESQIEDVRELLKDSELNITGVSFRNIEED